MTDVPKDDAPAAAPTAPPGDAIARAPLSAAVLAKCHVCPRCEAPATPTKSLQICVHCKKPFLLVSGARFDETVKPLPPAPEGTKPRKPVKVKYADAVMRYSAVVDDEGVTFSELDPVTGHIPVGRRALAFGDVVSVGIYRRVDWLQLVILVLLYFFPVVLPLLYFSLDVLPLFALSLPALALFVLGVRKVVVVGVQRMRITSEQQVVQVRFDTPMWKRKKFLDAVLSRSGIGDTVWK